MCLKFEAEVTSETPKALCCYLNGDRVNHWIARSQIQPGSTVQRSGDRGLLIVSEWFAQQARLPKGEATMPDNKYPDSGALFKNDKKREGTKDPDHTGTLSITCDKCGASFTRKLAAWIREAKSGRNFFSLSCKPSQQQNKQTDAPLPMDDEDIPFAINFDVSPDRRFRI